MWRERVFGLRSPQQFREGLIWCNECCMAGAQVRSCPDECVLPHPNFVTAARLPPPRAEHTGAGLFRASTRDESILSSSQARRHMAPWAAKRDHHSPCKRKPKIEVRIVGPGGDRGVGEVDKRGPRYPKGNEIGRASCRERVFRMV